MGIIDKIRKINPFKRNTEKVTLSLSRDGSHSVQWGERKKGEPDRSNQSRYLNAMRSAEQERLLVEKKIVEDYRNLYEIKENSRDIRGNYVSVSDRFYTTFNNEQIGVYLLPIAELIEKLKSSEDIVGLSLIAYHIKDKNRFSIKFGTYPSFEDEIMKNKRKIDAVNSEFIKLINKYYKSDEHMFNTYLEYAFHIVFKEKFSYWTWNFAKKIDPSWRRSKTEYNERIKEGDVRTISSEHEGHPGLEEAIIKDFKGKYNIITKASYSGIEIPTVKVGRVHVTIHYLPIIDLMLRNQAKYNSDIFGLIIYKMREDYVTPYPKTNPVKTALWEEYRKKQKDVDFLVKLINEIFKKYYEKYYTDQKEYVEGKMGYHKFIDYILSKSFEAVFQEDFDVWCREFENAHKVKKM